MTNMLAFAGSNSSTSINFELVKYTATLLEEQQVKLLNLANYPIPMYSEDVEKANGFSSSLMAIKEDIAQADGIIISVNEHNSNVSAYFKNLTDWLSRIDKKFLEGKKVLLMSTSSGKRGAIGALQITEQVLPRFGATVAATFSLPSFYKNFDSTKGIVDVYLATTHTKALKQFLDSI